MVKMQAAVGGMGIASSINSPLCQKISLKSKNKHKNNHKNDKKAFSVAEAMIALLIGSLALGMAAPMITKQIKQQNFQDVQFRSINKQLVPSGAVMFFDLTSCPAGWTNVNSLGWGGNFFRVADDANPRSVPQGDTIRAHEHGLSIKIDLPDVGTSWSGQGGGCPSRTCDHLTSISGETFSVGEITSTTDVFGGVETRPKNIPLTACRKD